MAIIIKDIRGYSCRERETNWTKEFVSREILKHRKADEIDHPDGSVTEAKIASGAITEEKLSNEVAEKINRGDLLESKIAEEEKKRRNADDLKADKSDTFTKTEVLENLKFKIDKSETETLLENKVDKVEGMGLSQNSFTDEEKEKLASLDNFTLPEDVVQDGNYVHTDNNFTTEDKEKVHFHENADLLNKLKRVKPSETDFDCTTCSVSCIDFGGAKYWKNYLELALSTNDFRDSSGSYPRDGSKMSTYCVLMMTGETSSSSGMGFDQREYKTETAKQTFQCPDGTIYRRTVEKKVMKDNGETTFKYSDFSRVEDETKQNKLMFDLDPTSGSANIVNSDGIYRAISNCYTKEEIDLKLTELEQKLTNLINA